jgi:2-polyprenyl-3-methyl-5-hydroxy-6-metoxy-1,4-benzoquinol methylase
MAKSDSELARQAKIEAEFFDSLYEDADRNQRSNNYLVPEKFVKQVTNPKYPLLHDFEYAYSLLGDIKGKKVLDYGAGDGWNSICFAKAKANVWAIDISGKGIDLIKKKAEANSVGEFIVAEVQNCYNTQFPANMFEAIYGGGVLHHLDIEMASREICRILNPNGVAVFYEPFRESKIMDFLKKVVLRLLRKEPSTETENESPLTYRKIDHLKSHFGVVNFRPFNVMTSVSPLINSETVELVLMWLDYVLMKLIPGFRKLCKAVVIELRQPIKNV